MPRVYNEEFTDGPGGWIADVRSPLPIWDGVAHCYSPWTVDANHAPPGAGYLHLLMFIYSRAAGAQPRDGQIGGKNRFVEEDHSTNLTNAKLTIRSRGHLDLAGPLCNNHRPVPAPDVGGAQMCLLVQAEVGEGEAATTTNFVLTGQPFDITPEWSEQTIELTPDPEQWTCLGARHDLTATYGYGEIAAVLADVNYDFMFILFPLNVVPVGEVEDRDRQWAAIDYKVDMQNLPKGLIMFDRVQIKYPE